MSGTFSKGQGAIEINKLIVQGSFYRVKSVLGLVETRKTKQHLRAEKSANRRLPSCPLPLFLFLVSADALVESRISLASNLYLGICILYFAYTMQRKKSNDDNVEGREQNLMFVALVIRTYLHSTYERSCFS